MNSIQLNHYASQFLFLTFFMLFCFISSGQITNDSNDKKKSPEIGFIANAYFGMFDSMSVTNCSTANPDERVNIIGYNAGINYFHVAKNWRQIKYGALAEMVFQYDASNRPHGILGNQVTMKRLIVSGSGMAYLQIYIDKYRIKNVLLAGGVAVKNDFYIDVIKYLCDSNSPPSNHLSGSVDYNPSVQVQGVFGYGFSDGFSVIAQISKQISNLELITLNNEIFIRSFPWTLRFGLQIKMNRSKNK